MFAKPLRTYQRKTAKNTLTSLKAPTISFETTHNVETSHLLNNTSNVSPDDTLNDPFETTFDRIAKGAVVPPRPPDTYQDTSWHSSSDNTNIESKSKELFEHVSPILSTCNNNTSKSVHLTHSNIKTSWKYKSPRKRKRKVASKKTAYKKARTTSRNIIQEESEQSQKTQGRKKQASRTQRNKQKKQRKESRNLRNKNKSRFYSDVSILEDAVRKKDISCNSKKYSDQSIFYTTDDANSSQTGPTGSVWYSDSKYTSNCVQDVRSCFVKLNDRAVQDWYMLHCRKSLENEQRCNKMVLCADISETDKNNLTAKKTDAPSALLKDGSSFKRTSIKSCSVELNDSAVKYWILKKRSVNSLIAVEDEQNLSNTAVSNNNGSIFCPYVTKRNRGKLAKTKKTVENIDAASMRREQSLIIISNTSINERVNSAEEEQNISPVNISKTAARNSSMFYPYVTRRNRGKLTKIKEIEEKVDATPAKRKQSIVSSTPVNKRVKLPLCSIVLSPINGTIFDNMLHSRADEASVERDISNNIPLLGGSDQTDFCSSNKFPEETDSDVDLHEQPTQIVLPFLSQQMNTDIYTILTQKSNAQCDAEAASACSPSALPAENIVDQSQSLFSDTMSTFKDAINDTTEDNGIQINELKENSPSAAKSFLNCDSEVMKNSIESCDSNVDRKKAEKIFLKSGKHWARSLSILTNINNEENLDMMSLGKGKRWRTSVRDVLDMQKQEVLQSCLKIDKDATNLSCNTTVDVSSVPSFNAANKFTAIHKPTNHARLSKRISVRVVPNDTIVTCDMKDTPFLEAFGIIEKKSNAKSSHRKKLSVHNHVIIGRESTTARNVVLQKCSQSSYLPFSECFPDSYLEHCHKIGEGVYGEVFLHEHNGNKSVLKIIPIEGKDLVNGEPQKKFNEILSEIVIAKELANLKSNSTYRTDGFVEVKNVNCVVGKYPKKLVELWNVYDDNKTSDNDCPSMFGEGQLYITLELSHGGQDLEAFVFQTAEEACAVFSQIVLALAVAEKALEFEHRDLHWGNVLISRTKEPYVYYNLGEKEIKLLSKGMKVSIIDFTLSRMSYQGCCIYNDLSVDPTLFTAHGDYQFDIYRFMRDKIGNTWQKFEPYTNILWLDYILDKMITAVRYKKRNIKVHKISIEKLKKLKNIILQYNDAHDFVMNSDGIEFVTTVKSM